MKKPGYYPDFSTLSQQNYWDDATRKTVLDRVHNVPPIRYFDSGQARLLKAVMDRIIPQDDRDEQHRIPIVEFVDERLFNGKSDGYQFVGMPEDGEAHRLGLEAIETMARALHDNSFDSLSIRDQELLLKSIHDQKPQAAHEIWKKLPIKHYWSLLVQDAISVYYAHPEAWDEIGFGGPAYPRGYMRLEKGLPEPWEVREERYEWKAPEASVSDKYSPLKEEFAGGHPGQGGTH